MIVGNRTYTTRYILPFLFKDKTYFTDEYDFINAYISDINVPFYDNHIFILFKYNPEEYDHIENYMKNNSRYFSRREVFINGVFYLEYIYIVTPDIKEVINSIKEGLYHALTVDNKSKIIKFWNNLDLSYLRGLLEFMPKKCKTLEEQGEIVPEQDLV